MNVIHLDRMGQIGIAEDFETDTVGGGHVALIGIGAGLLDLEAVGVPFSDRPGHVADDEAEVIDDGSRREGRWDRPG